MKEKKVNNQNYYLFDASNQILGRLATQIVAVLSGKNSVEYTPNKKNSNWIIVINSDKVKLSGEKESKKKYWSYTGYSGGIKSKTFNELREEDSTLIINKAVKGMMPTNKLSKDAMKRLQVFKDEKHTFENIFKD